MIQQILAEEQAKARHCPRIGRNCLASGCMAWVERPLPAMEKVLPWPIEISKPTASVCISDIRERALEFRERACEALKPLMGTVIDGKRVANVRPAQFDLSEIRVDLSNLVHPGACTELGK